MKRFLKTAANTAGILGLVSRFAPNRACIFRYNGFRPPGPAQSPLASKLMPTDVFERHLKVFQKYGVPARPAGLFPEQDSASELKVVITIDNGYANTLSHAFPILQKYNWPAVLFLPTGFIDRESLLWTDWLEYLIWNAPNVSPAFRWNGSTIPLALYSTTQRRSFIVQHTAILRQMPIFEVHEWLRALGRHLGIKCDWDSARAQFSPLTWDQVRFMCSSGLISIGSRTVASPLLSTCGAKDQETELVESKRRIESELGEPCTILAYPHAMMADITSETESAVRKAGYSLAVTMEAGDCTVPPVHPFRLRRWGAGIDPAELAYLVSGATYLSA
jgi:peptidoglycan/xylan/chitin deacetylase (PgdA/CDA1 family)